MHSNKHKNKNMEIKKFAAIDIGTNAVRLYIANVIEGCKPEDVMINKVELIRSPLRLGDDVFEKGVISEQKKDKLILSLETFFKFMQIHEVTRYRVCATSAMRDAVNSLEVIEEIKQKTGIDIRIISGKEEAELLYLAENEKYIDETKKYLAIDLGGGSLEFTLFTKKAIILSKSFNIGTIRMLNKQVSKADMFVLKKWLKKIVEANRPMSIIGSGGNINKLYRMSEVKFKEPLHLTKLKYLYKYLKSHSYEDRVQLLGLNTDRADVIIPAAKIFIKVIKWAKAEEIYVPMVGLADGIVKQLYKDYIQEQNYIYNNAKKMDS